MNRSFFSAETNRLVEDEVGVGLAVNPDTAKEVAAKMAKMQDFRKIMVVSVYVQTETIRQRLVYAAYLREGWKWQNVPLMLLEQWSAFGLTKDRFASSRQLFDHPCLLISATARQTA